MLSRSFLSGVGRESHPEWLNVRVPAENDIFYLLLSKIFIDYFRSISDHIAYVHTFIAIEF